MGGISLCQSTFSPSLAHSAAHSFRTSSGAGLGGRSTRSTGHPDVGMKALLAPKDETIEALRGEVEAWREAARRKDHIIMALTDRIPAIEAPEDGQEATQEPTRGSGGVAREEPERRSWWRRVFGG